MKKTYLFVLLIAFSSLQAYATVFTVTVQNFQFSPATINNVQVGDTIKWTWVNGSHTTSSTSVPAGATTWDHAMTQSSTTFLYKVTKPGVYNYICIPHASAMTGSFTVSAVSAVSAINNEETTFNLRGNVVTDEFKIDFNLANSTPVDVRLYNLIGRMVRNYGNVWQGSGSFQQTYPVGDLPKGLYLLAIEVGNQRTTRRVIIE